MKRTMLLGIALIAFLCAGVAKADDCLSLTGNAPGTECVIDHEVMATGSLTFDETVRITGTGKITVTDPSLTIHITGGLIMEAGAVIDGGNRNCFGPNQTAYPISIFTTGEIDVQTGALIRSNGCSGGAIVIESMAGANIDGTVESVGGRTGTGATQGPGGGTITIKAACQLTVSDTGLISSRGRDPGADLVHLEACTVTVYGKVESTGPGHSVPNSPANHCADANRPGKLGNSTACVEIWGDRITIDSTGTHKGEVNADIGQAGGTTGSSWIDIYARTNVTITDGTGNNYNIPNVPAGSSAGFDTTFAVHANKHIGNGFAGIITIKSIEGDLTASGDVAQADNTSGGAKGGTVTVEATNNINLNSGTIFARGDFAQIGGYGFGGKINVRSFHGSLAWANGVVDARPIGTDSVGTQLLPANRGMITLQDCLAPPGVDVTTLSVPNNNEPPSPTVAGFSVAADNCVGTITKPDFVMLPAATCSLTCQPPATKRGLKYHDLNGNGARDPGEPTLADWEIHLFGQPMVNNIQVGPPIDLTTTTNAQGKYEFVVPPGVYTVCEMQMPDWQQTQPSAGADCTGHGGGFGYSILLLPGQLEENNDFGNKKTTSISCPEDPKAVLTRTVDPNGPHAGLPNYTSLQAAYDAASNGDVIGIFGKFTENVILGDHDGIEGDKTLKITQCTSAQFTAKDKNKPVFDITSTGNLTIVSPDSVGGSVGWRVATDGHHLKSIRANDSTGPGVLILGSGNEVSWNAIVENAVGMQVEGDSNDLRGGTIEENAGHGVWFTSTAANNSLQGATIQMNGGNGILVDGTLNTIKSNGRLNQNGLNGLAVTGVENTVQSNAAEQNALGGFIVTAAGNLLQDNKSSKNAGIGFDIGGGTSAKPNRLKSNASNNGSAGSSSENGGAELRLIDWVKSEGGNKADNIAIPKTTSPLKCSQFPANNATKNFTSAYSCGDGVD